MLCSKVRRTGKDNIEWFHHVLRYGQCDFTVCGANAVAQIFSCNTGHTTVRLSECQLLCNKGRHKKSAVNFNRTLMWLRK